MAKDGFGSREDLIQSATLEYLKVSQNGKVRRILEFFSNKPSIITVEKSKMGNPYHIIVKLAESFKEIKKLLKKESLKKRELKKVRDRFIVGFIFWTGVRLGEFLLTKRKDVDLISKTYNVPTLKQERRKKDNEKKVLPEKRKDSKIVYRPIPLNHVPLNELKLWEAYFELFEIKSDNNIVEMSRREVERRVKKLLGEEFTVHSLRHALGLFLYEYTKDIRTVAQILRHTNITNTLIYTRLSLEEIREKITLQ